MKVRRELLNIILAPIFLALSFVLPFFTGQIPEIGSMLCPMHLPILLCGFICGWKYGLIIGFIAPFFRSFILGMPPLFPTAFSMSFELATYGLLAGILYQLLPKKPINIYLSLFISMLGGRIIWGIVMLCAMGFNVEQFSLTTFWMSGFVNAIPGIIVQINLIPITIVMYNKLVRK